MLHVLGLIFFIGWSTELFWCGAFQPFRYPSISLKTPMAKNCRSLICNIYCRYRQILDKAIQFTDADQLESLKAFVEASMLPLHFYHMISLST